METQKLFESGRSKRFGTVVKVATRKLIQLDAAETVEFLRSPPGNRLEELKGDRSGQRSIRMKRDARNDSASRHGSWPSSTQRRLSSS